MDFCTDIQITDWSRLVLIRGLVGNVNDCCWEPIKVVALFTVVNVVVLVYVCKIKIHWRDDDIYKILFLLCWRSRLIGQFSTVAGPWFETEHEEVR